MCWHVREYWILSVRKNAFIELHSTIVVKETFPRKKILPMTLYKKNINDISSIITYTFSDKPLQQP